MCVAAIQDTSSSGGVGESVALLLDRGQVVTGDRGPAVADEDECQRRSEQDGDRGTTHERREDCRDVDAEVDERRDAETGDDLEHGRDPLSDCGCGSSDSKWSAARETMWVRASRERATSCCQSSFAPRAKRAIVGRRRPRLRGY